MDLQTSLPSLLPKAIAWAERESQRIAHSGRALTEREQGLAREAGVAKPEQIRIALVEALPLPDNPELRAAALQTGLLGRDTAGLTLGYSIFVCKGYEAVRLLTHEFRHVHQYEQAGSIAGFLPGYLKQVVEVGYANTVFEKDAIAHEQSGISNPKSGVMDGLA